jgi:hypothetical protein
MIHCSTYKILLGITGLVAVVLIFGRLFAGQIRQWEVSPDQKNIAECRVYNTSSATSSDLSTVQLRTRFNPFRHTVLSGLDYGAKLSIAWIDSKNLVVECGNCGGFETKCDTCGDSLYIVKKETRWHDVTIHYVKHGSK